MSTTVAFLINIQNFYRHSKVRKVKGTRCMVPLFGDNNAYKVPKTAVIHHLLVTWVSYILLLPLNFLFFLFFKLVNG